MMASPSLSARDLSFQVGRRIILDSLTFELNSGVNWIRGSNGTGKTTLLKLLGGALQPSRGQLLINGRPAANQTDKERQAVFLCGDDLPDLPWLRSGELISVYASIYQSIDQLSLNTHLRALNLVPILDTPVSALSLGERRKLQLAVAFAADYSLLLLDEPLNALDAAAAEHVKAELVARHFSESQVVVLTSHTNPNIASRAFDLCGGARSSLKEAPSWTAPQAQECSGAAKGIG